MSSDLLEELWETYQTFTDDERKEAIERLNAQQVNLTGQRKKNLGET